jgi:hypothetical protein
MSAQFNPIKPRTTPETRRLPGEPERQRPTERAFVIQFDPIGDGRSRLRGRAELVASGEAIRFRSVKQLVDFMVSIMRKRGDAEPPS